MVRASPEHAFRVFTEEMGAWWPLWMHSVGGKNAKTCLLEGRVGGRLYERHRDGAESPWGTVTAWEPPHRVAFSWHPGDDESKSGDVEVRFVAVDGGTRVELEHRGFARLGSMARKAFHGYNVGWDLPFGRCFADAVDRSGSPRWLLRLRRATTLGAMFPRLAWAMLSVRLRRA